ncbi:hypothetical protein RIF29_14686 [Crotalaria pallida]|uniref:Ubiquitin-like protease family profile domain-containing protein n=1 Tax=Crotalaria pallida TaxID=3830 RepID=A0AAN9FC53_CROPI
MNDKALGVAKVSRKFGEKVPKQPNGIDCGYYAMKFMKEIVQHHEADKIPQMYFDDCSSTKEYSHKQLENHKEEFAAYLLESWSILH